MTVVDCPTGDSVLDEPNFRRALKELYDSAGTAGPYPQRRELAGGFYRDPNSDTTIFAAFVDSLSTPCTFNLPTPFPTSPPIPWLVAIPHVHPSDTVEVVPPNTCPKALAGGETRPGTSPSDDSTAFNSGVAVFAIDKRNVYRTTGPNDSDHKWWPRQSSCSLF